MKRSLRTAVLWTVRIVLAAVLLVNTAVLILYNTAGESPLQYLPFGAVTISGISMEPELRDGDAIAVYQTPFEDLAVGDTVVFSRDGQLIAHKIIALDGENLITQGTANPSPDAPVSAEEYRARMVLRLPWVGNIWRISAKPANFAVLAVFLILLIFGGDIFSALYRSLFEKDRKKEIP